MLGQAIAQMVRTGRWAQLERLRGAVAPEQLFQSIPGVGPELARRLHEHLDVDTLPILHTERGDWHFTALFSNTARAHELGRSRDWVVIYFHQDSGPDGQHTVATETRGPAAGSRVVRGREAECRAHLRRNAGLASGV